MVDLLKDNYPISTSTRMSGKSNNTAGVVSFHVSDVKWLTAALAGELGHCIRSVIPPPIPQVCYLYIYYHFFKFLIRWARLL